MSRKSKSCVTKPSTCALILEKYLQKSPMLYLFERPSISAEISTDSSTIWWSFLESEATFPIPTISSWETMSTEGTTLQRPSVSYWPSKSGTRKDWPSWGEIMSREVSHKTTGSTINAWGSTRTTTSGKCWLNYSTICPWRRLSRDRYSGLTVDCHQISNLWMISGN